MMSMNKISWVNTAKEPNVGWPVRGNATKVSA